MSGPEEAKLRTVRTANPETLRTSAEAWRTAAEALTSIENVLASYHDDLGASWTGASSEQARTSLSELKNVVAVHRERMTKAKQTIGDAADAFDVAEAGLREVEAIDVPSPGAAPTPPDASADDAAHLSYASERASHIAAVNAQAAAERARETRAGEVNRKLEESLQESNSRLGEIAPTRDQTTVDTGTGPSPQSTSPRTSSVRTYDPTQAPVGGTTSTSTHFADQPPSTGVAPTIGGGQTGQPGLGHPSPPPGSVVGDTPALGGDGQGGGSTGGSLAAGTGSAAAGAAGLAAAKRIASSPATPASGRGGTASKPIQLGGTGTRGSQPVIGGRGPGAATGTNPGSRTAANQGTTGRGSATGTNPGSRTAANQGTTGRGSATGTNPGRGAATGTNPGRGSATGTTPGSRTAANQGTTGRGAATGTSTGRGSSTGASSNAGSRGAATGAAAGRRDRTREDDQRIDHLAFEDDQWLDPEETAPGVIG